MESLRESLPESLPHSQSALNEKRKRKENNLDDKEKAELDVRNEEDIPEVSGYFPRGTNLSPRFGRVAVAKFFPGKARPKIKGFRNVLVHSSNKTFGGSLSPFHLKNEFGQVFENVWQFSKLYPSVHSQRRPLSRFTPSKIIWEHPSETHAVGENPTDLYWKWRRKGMSNAYAVRYPNGFHGAKECLCAVATERWLMHPHTADPSLKGAFQRLSYIDARKKIYCVEYSRLAQKTYDFLKMKAMIANGENLLLLDVDGPPPNEGYRGYPYDRVTSDQPGLLLDESIIRTLLNDKSLPFGHSYVLGALLIGGEQWLK